VNGLGHRRAAANGRAVWLLAVALVLWGSNAAHAQSNTRLLLASGWGVPGHSGYVFGPFSHLAMNEAQEIVFLSSLRGAKRDLRAIIRSTGVTFAVVAFEGLRAPVRGTSYESFSAPSLNSAGTVAFAATLKDDVPSSAVIRVERGVGLAVATSGGAVPGNPGASFQEFSAPVINSEGNILFGARTAGSQPATGLYLWTPRGLQTVALPLELKLAPSELLTPVFASHDEAVFVSRGTSLEAVTEQFFRAVAIRTFQDLKPPPEVSETGEILAARSEQAPVKMLWVLMEGDRVEMGVLNGDPSQPVLAKRYPGIVLPPLSRIQGQTAGPRGNIIFAAAPAGEEKDLALYCLCEGQVNRLTSAEEFLAVSEGAQGRPILSLAGDGQRTMTFIVPDDVGGDSVAIYVTSVP